MPDRTARGPAAVRKAAGRGSPRRGGGRRPESTARRRGSRSARRRRAARRRRRRPGRSGAPATGGSRSRDSVGTPWSAPPGLDRSTMLVTSSAKPLYPSPGPGKRRTHLEVGLRADLHAVGSPATTGHCVHSLDTYSHIIPAMQEEAALIAGAGVRRESRASDGGPLSETLRVSLLSAGRGVRLPYTGRVHLHLQPVRSVLCPRPRSSSADRRARRAACPQSGSCLPVGSATRR